MCHFTHATLVALISEIAVGLEKAKFLGKYKAYDKTLWTLYTTYIKDCSHKKW